jgi:methylmalonyl-CoA epimerase
MKAKRIDHVGIVVKDVDAAVETFKQNFGFTVSRSGKSAVGRNAFMPVGDTDLEFMEVYIEEGPVARYQKQFGQGAFMLSIEVDDLEAAVAHLRALGARVSDPAGATAFVSTSSAHGVLIQLLQRNLL